MALRQLSAQVIQTCGSTEEETTGGLLPKSAQEPEGFANLLAAAAERRRNEGLPLVLVVDGLDEAERISSTGLPLGLPGLLPPGVYLIGTYRTGSPPAAADGPSIQLSIDAADPRNQEDVDAYLRVACTEELLARRLAEEGVDPSQFAANVAARCGGVWLYLEYVLAEVRYGQRRVTKLDELPADLSDYYLATLTTWQAHSQWRGVGLPVITTLAAAAEPLPLATLARLAGVNDQDAVARWCDAILRPFLFITADRRYTISHTSLRELLHGEVPDADSGEEREHVAAQLAEATAASRERIADHYIDYFGGLDSGLPALAESPQLAEVDDGYPLRHLATHLADAARWNELHHLLTATHTTSAATTNVWFAAHDHCDTIDDFLDDVALAARHAAACTDAEVNAGRPALTLGREILYALMAASTRSMPGNVSPDLLKLLVTVHVWPPAHAYRHACRLVDPARRAEALTELAPYLPETLRGQAIEQAFAAATAVPNEYTQAEVLSGFAPHLPDTLHEQALAAATAIDNRTAQAKALTALAPHLPDTLRNRATEQALVTATAIPNEYLRAEALTDLAPHLPAALHERAFAAATAIRTEHARARALAGLAPHLSGTLRNQAIDHALAAATAIRDEKARAGALTALAPHLPDAPRTRAIEQILAAPTTVGYEYSQAASLTALAPHLPETLHEQALAFATGFRNEDARTWALTGLAPHLPNTLIHRALSVAVSSARRAVPAIAQRVETALPDLSAGSVIALVRETLNQPSRSDVLNGLTSMLPALVHVGGPHLVTEAAAAILTVSRWWA